MTKPRLAFVLEDVLGWKTYRSRLETVLEGRHDVETEVFVVSHSRRQVIWRRRNNMKRLDHFFRFRDPISCYPGQSGNEIRSFVRSVKPSVIHFAGHWPAAAINSDELPFTAALDNTRPGIERDLPRKAWRHEDMERERALLSRASHLFPMSEWAKSSLCADFSISENRITVLPPSIQTDSFPVKSDWKRNGRLKIIFIGNDLKRKGAFDLAAWIAGPLKDVAELHVVSTDGAAKELSDKAIIHGRVENARLVSEILPSMDVLCLPTRSDMSPQVIVEAAAAGLPVVASSIGGIPDLVIPGKTGFTIAPDDPSGFVEALRELAYDVALAKEMGLAARERAINYFDASRNFNMLIDRMISISCKMHGETE